MFRVGLSQTLDLNASLNGGAADSGVTYEAAPGSAAVLTVNSSTGVVTPVAVGAGVVLVKENGVTIDEIFVEVLADAEMAARDEIEAGTKRVSVSADVVNPVLAPAKAGYVAGGYLDSRSSVSAVDKFLFSDDSRSTLATGLSEALYDSSGFSSSTSGYVVGGNSRGISGPPVLLSVVDKFLFSNDSRLTLSAQVSSYTTNATGFSSSVAGYVAGGVLQGASTTNVDKFLFSDDSRSTLAVGLANNTSTSPGFSSSSAGYVAGGFRTLNINKFLFSDDSRSVLAVGLSSDAEGAAGMSSASAGYVAGGGYYSSSIYKFLFSNDSRSTLGVSLGAERGEGLAGFSSSDAGYAAGGYRDDVGENVSTVERLLFSNESISTLATGLSAGKSYLAAFQNK